jgi:hypothetical protein
MQAETLNKKVLGRKVAHELGQLTILTAYLAVLFCSLSTYSMLLLHKFHISYFAYGTALINALLTAKVILIGEAVYMREKSSKTKRCLIPQFGKPSCSDG